MSVLVAVPELIFKALMLCHTGPASVAHDDEQVTRSGVMHSAMSA